MNDLKHIVSSFSQEEKHQFLKSLESKNKRNDTKNIQLFKLLENKTLTSKDIQAKLYENNNRNAYHALRKRLYASIIDFIANTTTSGENNPNIKVIQLILAARNLLFNEHYKSAYKILNKAEDIAKAHDLFPYLNEIYYLQIQFAHNSDSVDLNLLIDKFKDNQKQYFLENELNLVYAKIRQAINNITYKGDVIHFEDLLQRTFSEHNISVDDSMSFKALFQIMDIINLSAFATKDYFLTEPFVVKTYHNLSRKNDLEQQPFYHIQVLYIIANTLFRNKKFKPSLNYLQLMHQQMHQHKNKYYNTFKLKYNLLTALNLNFMNKPNEAALVLEQFIIKKHPDFEALLDIYLSLVMVYFQQEEFEKANRIFAKFYHTDKWYSEKAGIEWTIKKNLMDILLQLELDNIDLFESRLLSFKRNYFRYLQDIKQERVISYLNLVEDYFKHPEHVTSKHFHDKVEASFEWVEAKKEDIFVMSFYAWLKSKMDNKPIYQTTIELIQKAQAVK